MVVQTAGVSKAILAFLDPDRRESILRHVDFVRFTDSTITSKDAFLARLEEVRQNGWAYDDGEYEAISNCVAAPVWDYAGTPAGAISITALKAQLDLSSLKSLLPDLLETTRAVSTELGWRPELTLPT